MRGHHQENHVIDHLIDRQHRAILTRGGGELAEHILPAASLAATDRLAGEPFDQELAARCTPAHRGEWQRLAHDAHRGGDHIDESLVDLICFGPQRHAEEAVRRQIKRQLLDRRIELHLLARPFSHPRRDPAVQRIGIVTHRLGLEGNRQCPAINSVVIEIHQHQSAREQ